MDEQSLDMQKPVTEIEHGHTEYTDEEIQELSQFNAQALLMASSKALGDDEATIDAWAAGVADVFLGGWDQRAWEPAEVLDSLLTNYRSFGANVIEYDLAATPAIATIADLPDVELCESLGTTDVHADVLFRIGVHLVSKLGRDLSWSRDAETGDVSLAVS